MKKTDMKELKFNPMTMIGDEWMLLSAGTETGYNTMTVSWGHMGYIWGKPTVVVYVRPQRYTKQFIDKEDLFTLCVPGEEYRKQLAYLGSHSGRDEDKVAKMDMHPVFHDGTVSFEESKLTFVCRKLYRAPLLADGFIDKSIINTQYSAADYHDIYVAEILEVYTKD